MPYPTRVLHVLNWEPGNFDDEAFHCALTHQIEAAPAEIARLRKTGIGLGKMLQHLEISPEQYWEMFPRALIGCSVLSSEFYEGTIAADKHVMEFPQARFNSLPLEGKNWDDLQGKLETLCLPESDEDLQRLANRVQASIYIYAWDKEMERGSEMPALRRIFAVTET